MKTSHHLFYHHRNPTASPLAATGLTTDLPSGSLAGVDFGALRATAPQVPYTALAWHGSASLCVGASLNRVHLWNVTQAGWDAMAGARATFLPPASAVLFQQPSTPSSFRAQWA
ncbi:hypothetical protein PAPYR_4650 [Paratrimastix pyriformis]|uniref:Uncharacterized protein n=1 Tax=Paratrimastix pyriformis TaxID=342808 RepID=A0ABQ8ULN0_9EUKA|nr:hypothetical protein PAPYR_4650 [Paratrimastix pyriformis]